MSVIPGSIASHNTLEDPPRFWALVTLFFAPAFIFANMYTTQAILPELSKAFSISAPTAGLTVSVLVLAVALGSLFYGPLSDRNWELLAAYSEGKITVPTLFMWGDQDPTLEIPGAGKRIE